MKQILSVLFVAIAPFSAAAEDGAWVVKDEAKSKVAAFLKTSPIAAEMRREKEPNKPVRLLKQRAPGLVMSDDLVACLHLTNPDNEITLDSGGGFDIDIHQVKFPGGDWDVHLRIREMQVIDELDSKFVLVLDKMLIGTLRFDDDPKMRKALKLLTKACF